MKGIFDFILLIILSNIECLNLNRTNNSYDFPSCNIDKVNITIKHPFTSDVLGVKKRKRNLNSKNGEFQQMRIYIDKTYLTYQKNNNPLITNSIYSIITNGLDKCALIINKL